MKNIRGRLKAGKFFSSPKPKKRKYTGPTFTIILKPAYSKNSIHINERDPKFWDRALFKFKAHMFLKEGWKKERMTDYPLSIP